MFTYNGELYIYGGRTELRNFELTRHDLWKYNLDSSSWREVRPKPEGKGPRRMCFTNGCMVGDRAVIFGTDITPNFTNEFRSAVPIVMFIVDMSPSLKTLCKLAVIRCGLECSEELPHNICWELEPMTK